MAGGYARAGTGRAPSRIRADSWRSCGCSATRSAPGTVPPARVGPSRPT